ncbi:hypothetical protein BFW01_g1745 [Lasiodiplodia theobromae]|nr:hypothetical protein BFW01_g1745 [Lasiodiplodia theobromae]
MRNFFGFCERLEKANRGYGGGFAEYFVDEDQRSKPLVAFTTESSDQCTVGVGANFKGSVVPHVSAPPGP